MGEEEAKTPVLVRGELSFHRFLAREEQRREWIMKICRKNTPLTQNTCVCGAHFDGGKRQRIFLRSCKICVDYACEKRAVDSRPPGCKVPGRSTGDGG